MSGLTLRFNFGALLEAHALLNAHPIKNGLSRRNVL